MVRDDLKRAIESGQPQLALEMAQGYFALPMSDPGEAVWIAIMGCHAAGLVKRWGEALRWADRGLALNRHQRNDEANGWLNFLAGTAAMYVGDLLRAERSLAACRMLAVHTTALDRLQPDGMYNLGCLMRLLKRPSHMEISCFKDAEQVYVQQSRFEQALMCKLEVSWSHLLQGEAASARTELDTFESEFQSHGTSDLRVYAEIDWALYFRLQGDLMESERRCQLLLSSHHLNPDQRADALWIMALNAQDTGNTQDAQDLADQAYNTAIKDFMVLQVDRIQAVQEAIQASQVGR